MTGADRSSAAPVCDCGLHNDRETACTCDGRYRPSTAAMSGKAVVAHPTRVAEADQLAAAEAIERVVLKRFAPTTHVYILDIDKLTELPEDGFHVI